MALLHCPVQPYIVLYCTMLYYTVLYCIVLCCTVPIIPCCKVLLLYHAVLYFTFKSYIISYWLVYDKSIKKILDCIL